MSEKIRKSKILCISTASGNVENFSVKFKSKQVGKGPVGLCQLANF